MTDKAAWQGQTGAAWAKHYWRTDRSFTGLTDRLLGRASARPITKALDVGCGAGELSMALGRGHSGAEIIGVDVSQDLIAAATGRGAHLANVSFECTDAAEWGRAGYAPDLIVSRHGVMFFDNPTGAFTHLASIAAPKGRLVFSCFRDVQENPWAAKVASFLPVESSPPTPAGAPGPFAFADPRHVEPILSRAGWQDIAFEPVDFAYIAGVGDNAVEEAMAHFQVIGPAAKVLATCDEDVRARFRYRLRTYLENNADDTLVALKGSAWIVSANAG